MGTAFERRVKKLRERYYAALEEKRKQTQEKPTETEKVEKTADFPKHVGGGYYELSNGEKIRGKDAAIKAEKALSGE